MTKEIPITNFSCFGPAEFREELAFADKGDLSMILQEQPDLTGGILFELWRNHRSQEAFYAIALMEDPSQVLDFCEGEKILGFVAKINIHHSQTYKHCEAFLKDVFEIVCRVKTGVSYLDNLNSAEIEKIHRTSQTLVEGIKMYKRQLSRLN